MFLYRLEKNLRPFFNPFILHHLLFYNHYFERNVIICIILITGGGSQAINS